MSIACAATPRAGQRARVVLRRVAAALPDLGIAAAYVAVARDPAAWDSTAGTALWRAAIMEFWAIHAAGFLMWTWVAPEWNRGRRALFVAVLAAAYSLVLGVASLVIGAWWPIATFWALTGNRAVDSVLREAPAVDQMREELRPWAGNIALFIIVAAVTGMAGASRLAVLVAGTVYFTANAVSEIGGWWWVRRWLG